jgi:NhaP-type Na+/H+ or K+/H+ antiporter
LSREKEATMSMIWGILLGVAIGVLIFAFTCRYMEWAERQTDTMTVYEQMIKGNPTAAGKK